MPGHGSDKTPFYELRTIADLAAPAMKIVAESKGKVVLVGHSYAGEIISTIAEQHPDKVKRDNELFCRSYLGLDTSDTRALPEWHKVLQRLHVTGSVYSQ